MFYRIFGPCNLSLLMEKQSNLHIFTLSNQFPISLLKYIKYIMIKHKLSFERIGLYLSTLISFFTETWIDTAFNKDCIYQIYE